MASLNKTIVQILIKCLYNPQDTAVGKGSKYVVRMTSLIMEVPSSCHKIVVLNPYSILGDFSLTNPIFIFSFILLGLHVETVDEFLTKCKIPKRRRTGPKVKQMKPIENGWCQKKPRQNDCWPKEKKYTQNNQKQNVREIWLRYSY